MYRILSFWFIRLRAIAPFEKGARRIIEGLTVGERHIGAQNHKACIELGMPCVGPL